MNRLRKSSLFSLENREFFSTLAKISLPIVVQRLLNALLFMLDNVMVGGLGEGAVAAVGMANKLTYLMNVFTFGIMSATSIFAGQYWGKRDIPGMRRVQGISQVLLLAVGGFFMVIGLALPAQVMSIWSSTPEVIEMGSAYLRVVAVGYLFQVTSQNYATILKSCEMTLMPLISSIVAMAVNFVINYTLINGHFGFPALGATGAAIGTTAGNAVGTPAAIAAADASLQGVEAAATAPIAAAIIVTAILCPILVSLLSKIETKRRAAKAAAGA